jgi:hypothetical protein
MEEPPEYIATTEVPFIALLGTNTFRICYFPDYIVTDIISTISSFWIHGINNHQPGPEGYHIALNGHAWIDEGIESIYSLYLISKLLQDLARKGWVVLGGVDLVAVPFAKDTLFFRFCDPDDKASIICVAPAENNRLRLIGAPSGLVNVLREAINRVPDHIVLGESKNDISHEFVMNGEVWYTPTSGGNRVIGSMLSYMQYYGWSLKCSINASIGKANIGQSLDSLYFQYIRENDASLKGVERNIEGVPFIQLFGYNELHLYGFLPKEIEAVKAAIKQSWPAGIVSDGFRDFAYVFRLLGTPFASQARDAVMANFMIRNILAGLLNQGWHLISSIDLIRHEQDLNTLYFNQAGIIPPINGVCPVMCIAFSSTDRLRVIGGRIDLFPEIESAIRDANAVLRGRADVDGSHEFNIDGSPWLPRAGDYHFLGSRIIASIISRLEYCGWQMYASIDVCAAGPIDLDSLFFRYDLTRDSARYRSLNTQI